VQRSANVPRNQAECLDEAKADPAGPKGVVQSYCNGPGPDPAAPFAKFGEIEIQLAPAGLTAAGNDLAVTVLSDLLAFEGDSADILALGRVLLGIDDVYVFE
jgi:hypothetical protein